MTTRHLVDPALLPGIARPPTRIATAEMLPPYRASLNKLLSLSPKLPGAITRRQVEIPGLGDKPPVRALVYQPSVERQPAGAILHIHGGGFIIGVPEMNDARNAAWCDRLDVVVLSVDYRLAPEAAYPAALHDCHAALTWLTDHAPELRISSRPLGVAGESAGGGLAAALALFARDRGQRDLAFQLLTYPMLDDRTATVRPPGTLSGEFVWTAEDNRFGWRCLLGREPGGADVPSYAAPARSADLSGLPPTFIAVGALDLFRDENIDYAQRLLNAGVPTELHVYPGAYHGFDMVPNTPPAKRLAEDCLGALQRWFRNE